MSRIEILKETLQSLKKGGKIHIKKENRGKFTSYCGGKVTSECIARGKNSPNPAIRKRATFAANARKWKHEDGGILYRQNGGLIYKQFLTDNKTNKNVNSLVYQQFDSKYPDYPVEPVEIYTPHIEFNKPEEVSSTESVQAEPLVEVTTEINKPMKPSYEITIENNNTKPADTQIPLATEVTSKSEVLNHIKANNNNLNEINKRLKEAGYKKTQRAAILATIVAESGANPTAIGDSGKAKGLFQWHPNRFSAGIDLGSQIKLLLTELRDFNNQNAWTSSRRYNKRNAFDLFHNTEDLSEAVSALTANYIRPANTDNEIRKRYNIAQQLINQMV